MKEIIFVLILKKLIDFFLFFFSCDFPYRNSSKKCKHHAEFFLQFNAVILADMKI